MRKLIGTLAHGRLRFTPGRALTASAALGATVGASFGQPGGWLTIQLCLIALIAVLCQVGTPRAAGWSLAGFAAAMLGAGHLGFILGLPVELRALACLPLLALVLAHAACAWLVGFIAFRLPAPPFARLVLALPSLWLLTDWLFSLGELAVPWLRLGAAQAPAGPLAGALPLGGVLLAGWFMLALSAVVVLGLQRAGACRPVGLAALATVCVLGLQWSDRAQWTQNDGALSVALVQGGTEASGMPDDTVLGKRLTFLHRAVTESSADLVITSQLAIPKTPDALPPDYLRGLHEALERKGADALLGIHLSAPDGHLFNAVLGLGASGVQRYLKHQLFPFGEFLPFGGRIAQWLRTGLPRPTQDMARPPEPGDSVVAGDHRLAPAVCFEAAFADAWRRRAVDAGLLVNLSSDSAIASPQLLRQFRQIAQARALELQKPLLRSSDGGGSLAIDHRGGLVSQLQQAGPGVLKATVNPRQGLTPYGRWGDGFALLIALLCLGIVALAALGRQARAGGRGPRAWGLSSHGAPAQSGQVLPLSIVLVLVMASLFYLMTNAGQTVVEKMRVTNAADAAAYSAAVLEARALNHDAYLNRAMVANQIAIVQLLSVASWIDYFAVAIDGYGAHVPEIHFFLLPQERLVQLDAVLGGTDFILRRFGMSAQEFATLMKRAIGPMITAHDASVQALAAAQEAVHANLLHGVRQRQVANDIVQAMDPDLRAEVVQATHSFDGFTRRYVRHGRSGDERGRFADVVLRSRDAFTRERNWSLDADDIPLLRKDPALKKRGGTDLIGFDEWRAVDTLELHGSRWGCGKFGLSWCDDVQRPVGWGAASVGTSAGDVAGAGAHGNAHADNPRTASQAVSSMATPPNARFSGIPETRGLTDLRGDAGITTGVTVRVHKDEARTLTAGNAALARPGGRLALFDPVAAGGQIAALSRAEVFFDRIAARRDGKHEIGSLFNPYWRVRMVAPTAADKAEAAEHQGGLVLP